MAALSWFIFDKNVKTTAESVQLAQNKLQIKEKEAESYLKAYSGFIKNNPHASPFDFYKTQAKDLFQKEGITIVIYHHDTLCFWSDNRVPFDLVRGNDAVRTRMIKLRNGWYERITAGEKLPGGDVAEALILIKSDYNLENKYLKNQFVSWLELPENSELEVVEDKSSSSVESYHGSVLFKVINPYGLTRSKWLDILSFILFLIFIGFLLTALYRLLSGYFKNDLLMLASLSLITLFLRIWMIKAQWPGVFYYTLLFDPAKFADANSFFFSSLGDVLINSVIIFIFSFIFYRRVNLKRQSKYFYPVITIVVIFFFVFSYYSIGIIKSLVVNSTISFNINDLFGLSTYSILAFFCVGLLWFSLYFLIEKAIIYWLFSVSGFRLVIYLCLISVCYSIIAKLKGLEYFEYLFPVALLFISFLLRKFKASFNFINVGLIVLISAYCVSFTFKKYEHQNNLEKYKAVSYRISDRQDIIAENEFVKISNNIKNDTRLKNLIAVLPLSAEHVEQRIQQVYFSGYYDKYEATLGLFDDKCYPYFKSLRQEYLNTDYFQSQIDSSGIQTISDDLFFIDRPKEKGRYIAKIQLTDPETEGGKLYTLYVQLEPKLPSDLGSFPDLLMDKSLENQLNLGNISYGLYKDRKLISRYGDYNYPLFELENEESDDSDYIHHFYKNDENTTVVISETKRNGWYDFTSVSYFFVFFSALVLIMVLIHAVFIRKQYFIRSLNTRIQFILVLVVVLSLAGVVIGTVWVVNTQSEEKNKKELLYKSQNILNELSQSLGLQDRLELAYKDYTSYRLKKLAHIIGSDISLYDKDGYLFSSSRPSLFDQGLTSRWMNAKAFSDLSSSSITDYSIRENIGRLNYLSSYIPFYNTNNQLIGFLNLPYFSRQKDLEKELSAYLTTLINIYTILFAFTTLAALVVSNFLTKPLRLIKQQISKITLGKRNEPLVWNTNDEIGDLVNEYNHMLLKLEESSLLLAKSERESAWREMAKQVAHEIKNPLTPMKLNIQHLLRVMETNPEDLQQRVKKVSDLLVEQIDTLNHIANEFSNFAKLPKANIETVNISEVLFNVVELFKQNHTSTIQFNVQENIFVTADKEQCIRVFTNLLKNAEQAIPDDKTGQIAISTQIIDENVVVSVRDNGVGIPDEIKSKIFTPNFTTKSAGTGLGLAMVKNIITSFHGEVWFESVPNQQTVFYTKLPLKN